jgi:hypothetical protein
MAVVIPYVKNTTWADGSGGATPVSAAKLNVLEDGVFDAHNMPCARVTHNANQATVSGTPFILAFNTERYDTDTIHDTVTNNSRLTCKHAGVYDIGGCIAWSANAVDSEIFLWLNGATIIASNHVIADSRRQIVATHYKLAVNDYVELRVLQVSGSAKNVITGANYSPEFWMARLASG